MLQDLTTHLTTHWLGLDPTSRLGGAIDFFLYDTLKIFLLLASMIFAIGLIRTWLPLEKLRHWMQRGGLWGNLLAALFGAITPFCSCSSIPLFIGFLKAGAPLGVTFSFLISSPLINEYLVVLMVGEFGLPITAAYVLSGLAIAVGAGALLGRLPLEQHLEKDLLTPEEPTPHEQATLTLTHRLQLAWREVTTIIRQIWAWVLLGVALGAFIHNYVPQSTIQNLVSAAGPLSVPLATLLGVPMYGSCAAIVPVAVVLFEKGIPLGTALAFMMAMAALSLPEAIMLRRIIRLPLIALFFLVTTLGIILTGYLLNALAPHL